MKLILLNKPYDMLSQFTDRSPEAGGGPAKTRPTLADILPIKDVYPAGRLDRDSEGLMLLTDYGPWQARIAEPGSRKWQKTYWVQVEGTADPAIADQLRSGVTLKDGPAKAQYARLLPKDFQDPWPRKPPIRERRSIPTFWLELTLSEGRNRQVRRMCAAVDRPCLRLIRAAIGPLTLEGLAPGMWRSVDTATLDPGLLPPPRPDRKAPPPKQMRHRIPSQSSPQRNKRNTKSGVRS